MSLKTCPKCDKKLGNRTKTCPGCKYEFAMKSNHPLVPEPGGWVLDTYKGLPKIEPPDELPSGKLSVQQVYEQVSYEGLGFCIYHLIPVDRIADRKLRNCGPTPAQH